ncbi:MAG: hypothetical protein WC450_01365 [Candidatus Omnitrophota bacterium]
MMGVNGKQNEDLIAGLIRKQIDDLNHVLQTLEAERVLDEYSYQNLKRVERQIHRLRTVVLGSLLN